MSRPTIASWTVARPAVRRSARPCCRPPTRLTNAASRAKATTTTARRTYPGASSTSRSEALGARVILDQDYNDGELVEAELTFFAQDKHANVWTLGEYPEEYEDGRFAGAPNVWISGISGAVGGVLVPGNPRTGTRPFVQGNAPAIDFFDVGRVIATGLHVCVPIGCYDDVVRISETAPLAPEDGSQLKFYAPKVGLIQVTAQGGSAQETLTLTSLSTLRLPAMNAARNDARRLDVRGYLYSEDYGTTEIVHLDR